MKTRILIVAALGASLTSCATQQQSAPPAAGAAPQRVGDISNPEAENQPFIGMTKEEALARYGQPKKQTVTEEGENWVYILNLGEVVGKAMIPFYFGQPAIRTGVLIFGSDGRVKKFNWDVPAGE